MGLSKDFFAPWYVFFSAPWRCLKSSQLGPHWCSCIFCALEEDLRFGPEELRSTYKKVGGSKNTIKHTTPPPQKKGKRGLVERQINVPQQKHVIFFPFVFPFLKKKKNMTDHRKNSTFNGSSRRRRKTGCVVTRDTSRKSERCGRAAPSIVFLTWSAGMFV